MAEQNKNKFKKKVYSPVFVVVAVGIFCIFANFPRMH